MDILANAARVFVARNMAKLLEAMDDSQTTMKVDAAIFTAPNEVLIDAETVTVGTVAGSGEGYIIYNVTRGGSPTAHRANVNVLGPSPVELVSKTFSGADEFAGLFVSGEGDGVFAYVSGTTRLFYFQSGWGNQNIPLAWPPYTPGAMTVKILAWTHEAGVFSGVLF